MQRWAAHRRTVLPFCRRHSVHAQKIDAVAPPPIIHRRRPDDNANVVLAPELSTLSTNLLTLLGSAHPGLQDVAKHYFSDSSNLVRSCVILLFARATNTASPGWDQARWHARSEDVHELNQPLTRADILHDWNPNMRDDPESFDAPFALRTIPIAVSTARVLSPLSAVLPAQLRLVQIVEMINVASLLHDQVTLSPSDASNKLSILGGDFLLGRASAALSRLGSNHVVELIASVISNLSEGRVVMSTTWEEYLKNAYLKTGSLVAKGARSAVLLAGGSPAMQDIAYSFGRDFGMAMQLAESAAEGNARCRDVAHTYFQRASHMIHLLPHSDARDTLEHFVAAHQRKRTG